jgi:hypothetical protein
MEIENINMPIDKQDLDLDLDTQEYVDYLEYCVNEGIMDEDVANELIDKGEWQKIRDLMEYEDTECI